MGKKTKINLLSVKIYCIIISFVIWVYVIMSANPVITTKIYNIPVNLINSASIKEKGLVVIPDQKFSINLSIEGNATDIYNVKPESFEVIVDLSIHDINKGENILRAFLRGYPPNISIKNVEDLDIKILVDDFVEKKVLIDKLIDRKNKDGFYSFDPVITPESVTVSGASKYVNLIDKVVVNGIFEDLSEDFYDSLNVRFLDKNGNELNKFLDISPEMIEMFIRVRAIKEVEVEVPLVNNLPEGLTLESVEVVPKTIKIIGNEDVLSNIFKISSENVDLFKITKNSILDVQLKLPDNIDVIDNRKSVTLKVKLKGEVLESNGR